MNGLGKVANRAKSKRMKSSTSIFQKSNGDYGGQTSIFQSIQASKTETESKSRSILSRDWDRTKD